MEKIGNIIKRARVRKKLKAGDVGKLCNVSRSRVYQWESSKFIMPKNLHNLSEALGVSLKRLRSANGESPRF